MDSKKKIRVSIFVVFILLAIIIIRSVYFDVASEIMDSTFFFLVAGVIIILVVPWERVTSFKAGEIEITVDKPEVKAAIQGLESVKKGDDESRLSSEEFRARLIALKPLIEQIQGGRILWIDDFPHKVIAERRLLRALGAVVVTARSSEEAKETIQRDNDFDLIISDVQREGKYNKYNDGVDIHDGVNFIVWLREKSIDYPVIQSLPVLFYAAYDWRRLVDFTLPAKKTKPDVDLTNNPEEMIEKAILMLSKSRSVIDLKPLKEATGLSPRYLNDY